MEPQETFIFFFANARARKGVNGWECGMVVVEQSLFFTYDASCEKLRYGGTA